jgi:hypothetical protein
VSDGDALVELIAPGKSAQILRVLANGNDVRSAETAMLAKQHFIETDGAPDLTMGWGGSAGTMPRLLIWNPHPGIPDGVVGFIGHPEERSTTVTACHENPRIAAGGPQANDIVECQPAAPDRDSYEVSFTDEQWEQLLDIFDRGVGDWTRLGVGRVRLEGRWIRF